MQTVATGANIGDHELAQRTETLPRWAWLWMPLALFIIVLGVRFAHPDFYRRWVETESGLIENLTAAFLIPAVVFGVLAFRRRAALPKAWLGWWVGLLTAGALYFGGEEISWGQHWIGWETPESIRAVNEQQETNLHNMSNWLDQRPRQLLGIWIVVAGIGWAGRARYLRLQFDSSRDWRPWFWPTWEVFPAACLAVGIKLYERAEELTDWVPDVAIRYSELQEQFYALFILIYLWSLHQRLREQPVPDSRS